MKQYITDLAGLDKSIDILKSKKMVGLDTETSGLDPHSNQLLLIQIGDKRDQFVYDVHSLGKDINRLSEILSNESILKILHNAKFDLKFLKVHTNIECNSIRCTMICDQLLYAGKRVSHSLKNCLDRHLGIFAEKEEQKSFVGMKLGEDFTDGQIQYAAKDVLHLNDLYNHLEKLLNERNMLSLMDLEMETVYATCDMELNGIYLDAEKWLALKDRAEKEMISAKNELDSYFVDHCEVDMFGCVTVNYNSPKQLKPLLETITGRVLDSTSVAALKQIDHPVIKALLTYREHNKKLTTYGEDFLNTHVSKATGRVHSDFVQLGADSGRFASRNPNMTNIPSAAEYRAAFTVQDDSYKMISADFSGQELRLLAHMSKEPNFIKALDEGIDLHTNSASLIFGIPYDEVEKHQRTAAKGLTFGLIYGIGPKKLSENLDISYDEATQLMDKYYRTFPQIKALLDELVVRARKSHIAVSPLDRRQRDLTTFDWFNRREVAHALNITKNLPFQGAGASVTKKALCLIRKEFNANNMDAKIVNVIHDEIVVEAHQSCAEQASSIVKQGMLDAFKFYAPDVPMEVNPEISTCWVH